MAHAPIEKLILVSPSVEEITAVSPVTTVSSAEELRDQGLELVVEQQQFDNKAEYAELAVFQRALMLTDDTRAQFAVAFREASEKKSGSSQDRITTGESVLFSNSPTTNLQAILDAKVLHNDIQVEDPEQGAELIAVNVSPKGGIYIFGVTPIRTELSKVLGGTGTDKQICIASVEDTMKLLDGKEMEQNFVDTVHTSS